MKWFGNKGFSLIEVMVAMMLVAGIGMAVMEMIQWQNKSSRSISSVMDRNEITDKVRSLVSNSSVCHLVFGAAQSGGGPDYSPLAGSNPFPVPVIYDSTGLNPYLGPSNQPPGFTVKIISMALENSSLPSQTTGTPPNVVTRYFKTFKIKAEKVSGPAPSTPGQPIPPPAVGGNTLKDISVPIIVTVRNSTNRIKSCSFDEGTGSSADACGLIGYGRVMTATGMDCRKLLCSSGQFPVGTDVFGTSAGELHCCNTGEHFAGTNAGNPVCCGKGSYYDINSNSCKPITDLCKNGGGGGNPWFNVETIESSSDTDINCCHVMGGQDGSGTLDIRCFGPRPSYFAASYGGYCQGTGTTLHASMPLLDSTQRFVNGVHVDCNPNGTTTEARLNCCSKVAIPLANSNPPVPDCATDPTGGPNFVWRATLLMPNGSTGGCQFDGTTCASNTPPQEWTSWCSNTTSCYGLPSPPCASPNVSDGCGSCYNPATTGGCNPSYQIQCTDPLNSTITWCASAATGC